MRKILFTLSVAFVLQSLGIKAQELPTVIPPSPDAAAMTKHVDIPTNNYTGIPNISIPIHTIKTRELTVPISLSYHASGIKVDDIPSWVGMNWSVSYGGVINRTVKGIADERSSGYYTSNVFDRIKNYDPDKPLNLPLTDDYNELGKWTFQYAEEVSEMTSDINQIAAGNMDGQPDIFSFSFNGYSGKFYFDTDQSIVLFSEQDLHIEDPVIDNYEIKEWTVVTGDGTKYVFGSSISDNGIEFSGYDIDEIKYPSAWYITKIISADNSEEISYEYTHPNDWGEIQYRYRVPNVARGIEAYIPKDEYDYTVSTVKKIFPKKINFYGGYVEFHNAKRENGLLFYLDRIEIYQTLETRKLTYEFSYLDHVLIGNGLSPDDKFSLKDIVLKDATNNQRNLYEFTYDNQPVPRRGSFAQDLWGYYNGELDNESLVPTVIFNNRLSDGWAMEARDGTEEDPIFDYEWENYFDNFVDVSGLTKIKKDYPGHKAEERLIENANREPNAEKMQAGILKSIKYPTGGTSNFEFEPHDFSYICLEEDKQRQEMFHLDAIITVDSIVGIDTFKVERRIDYSYDYFSAPSSQEVDLRFRITIPYKDARISDQNFVTIYKLDSETGQYEFLKEMCSVETFDHYKYRIWLEKGHYKIKIDPELTFGIMCHINYKPGNGYNKTHKVRKDIFKDTTFNFMALHPIDEISVMETYDFEIEQHDEKVLKLNYSFESAYHPNVYNVSGPDDYTMFIIKEKYGPEVYRIKYYPCQTFCSSEDGLCENCGMYGSSDPYANRPYGMQSEEFIELPTGEYTIVFVPKNTTDYGSFRVSWKKFKERTYQIMTGGNRIKKITMDDGNGNTIEKEYYYQVHDLDYNLITTDTPNGQNVNVSSGVLMEYPKMYKLDPSFVFYWTFMIENNEFSPIPPLDIYGSPNTPMSTTNGGHIGYREVQIRYKNEGRSIYKYTSATEYPDITYYSYPYPDPISFDWMRGKLKQEVHIDSVGNVIHETINEYKPIKDILDANHYVEGNITKLVPAIVAIPLNTSAAYTSKYALLSDISLLSKSVKKQHTATDTISNEEEYFYKGRKLKSSISSDNNGKIIENKIYHEEDYNDIALSINDLRNNHIHNVPVKTEQIINGKLVSSQITNFNENGKPKEVYIFESDDKSLIAHDKNTLVPSEKYVKRVEYSYGSYGQLEQVRKVGDVNTIYFWGNNYTKPFAKIQNASLGLVKSILNEDSQYYPGNSNKIVFDRLRDNQLLRDSYISTYSYTFLFGLDSQTDPNGYNTYYDYDGFGRLKTVKDHNGNIVKSYNYQSYNDYVESPSNLAINGNVQYNEVNLIWNASTSYNYDIYRSLNGENFTKIANNVSTTSYSDLNVTENNTYQYYVVAYFDGVVSQKSNILEIRTPTIDPGPISGEVKPCPNSTQIYTIESVPYASSYNWQVSGNATIVSENLNNVEVLFGEPGPASISVSTVNDLNAESSISTLNYEIVYYVTDSRLETPTGNTLVCPNSTHTYTSRYKLSNNVTYDWSVPHHATILSGQGTDQIEVQFGPTEGNVSVSVVNECGSRTINKNLAVNIYDDVVFTTQPTSQSFCNGDNITLSVEATGSGLSYKWKKNGAYISGAENATFTISSASSSDVGSYSCEVTGTCYTVESTSANLTYLNPTVIASNPTGITVCEGDDINLSVGATGSGTVTYQWKQNGHNLVGKTSSTLLIENAETFHFGSYTCDVTADCGTVSSQAATVIVNSLARITSQPSSITVCEGTNVTFDVAATGTGLSYQWQYYNTSSNQWTNSTASGNQTNSVKPSAGYQYRCVVTGVCNSVTSNSAVLTVTPAIDDITAISGASSVDYNTTQTYSVTNDPAATNYSWAVPSGATITSGQGTSSINVSYGSSAVAGNISVTASNSCFSKSKSLGILIKSKAATSISATSSVVKGCNRTLSVSGGSLGTGASWKWYKSACGSSYVGTGSSISVSPSSNTTYYVRAEGTANTTSCVSKSITVNSVTFVYAPLMGTLTYGSGSQDVDVDHNGCGTWTVSSNQSWLTVTKLSSTEFSVNYTENPNNSTRTATLTLSMDGSNTTFNVTQQAAPEPVVADFSYTTSGRNGNLITFTDLSTGSPTNWYWDFDNNGTTDYTGQNPPSQTFSGSQQVKLTVSKSGSSDSIVKTVIIAVNPI